MRQTFKHAAHSCVLWSWYSVSSHVYGPVFQALRVSTLHGERSKERVLIGGSAGRRAAGGLFTLLRRSQFEGRSRRTLLNGLFVDLWPFLFSRPLSATPTSIQEGSGCCETLGPLPLYIIRQLSLLSHSACHHIGEIMDRVEMRQQLSAVREQPEAYQSSWRDSFMTSNAFLPRHLHRYLFKSSQNNFLSLLLLFSSFLFGAWMRCQVVT